MNTKDLITVFNKSISDYHLQDNVDFAIQNPYPANSFNAILYQKNWIDTVQWHLEDIIRNPQIDPSEALLLKRRIDASNQERTDMVEKIDDYFFVIFNDVLPEEEAKINTETLGWAIDRLSILCLKIFHMRQETLRTDANVEHLEKCTQKLNVLLLQEQDMTQSINDLHTDISLGKKKMRLYKQMKMYNDPALNPVLYKK